MSDHAKLIAVTNRTLCAGDYLAQLEKICAVHPASLILREKDLSQDAYAALAARVLQLCARYDVQCFLHSHADAALALGCKNIHFSLPGLREHASRLDGFQRMSVSCHSVEDVIEAARLGATQVLLGNIYETDCKKGLPGKGLRLLSDACAAVSIPVFAIGGVTPERLPELLEAGAAGGCMMSGFMCM